MEQPDRTQSTVLVQRLSESANLEASDAARELFPIIYDRLHRIAESFFRRQPDHHTLQPTALIHEAYLKLVDHESLDRGERLHFVRVAARAMRQVLTDHARARLSLKRGGAWQRLTLEGVADQPATSRLDVLALDEAVASLSAVDERQGSVVELRFFGGLNIDETATVLGVSRRTVELDWRMAKAWLNRMLTNDGEG